MLGLYIHIPFCRHICHYCDFYKMVVSKSFQKKYIKALLEEMKLKKLDSYKFDTLYIGGGTPSCLEYDDLITLLDELSKLVNLSSLKEFTVEVNPEDISDLLLKSFVKYHVSRISMGIQSFNPRIIETLGRHLYFSFDEIKNKIDLIKKYNITNINCDLIYAVADETLEEVMDDVSKFMGLGITHISTYSLILEEHTVLYKWYTDKKFSLTSENLDALMYQNIIDKLKASGFIHYETSNFAVQGYESKHNLLYWNCDEYIGLGAGAASYLNHKRYANVRNIEKYYDGLSKHNLILDDVEDLSLDDEKEYEVILGLRRLEGISKSSFYQKYSISIIDAFPNISKLIDEGLLEENNEYIKIPEKYSYIANHIIVKII